MYIVLHENSTEHDNIAEQRCPINFQAAMQCRENILVEWFTITPSPVLSQCNCNVSKAGHLATFMERLDITFTFLQIWLARDN